LCAYECAQLSYRTQHAVVLIIFPRSLQTIITAEMLSIGGEGYKINVTTTVSSEWTVRTITLQYNRFDCIDKFLDNITDNQQHTADMCQPLWSLQQWIPRHVRVPQLPACRCNTTFYLTHALGLIALNLPTKYFTSSKDIMAVKNSEIRVSDHDHVHFASRPANQKLHSPNLVLVQGSMHLQIEDGAVLWSVQLRRC